MTDTPVFISGFPGGTALLINFLDMHLAFSPWFQVKEQCDALRSSRILQQSAAAEFE
jgi:hypothetical protein